MGMTIFVEIVDQGVTEAAFDKVFSYFNYIDETFSTYKEMSEISQINRGLIVAEKYSADMREVFRLSEETKRLTDGYFDITTPDGTYDPSGLVKGWAIYRAANILRNDGYMHFYIDVGGDIQAYGHNADHEPWLIGIRNPFRPETEIIKVLSIENKGVATSGTYARGTHIYNPHEKKSLENDIVSLTVVGPNIYEADRFATAAFAMGKEGIAFIENLDGFEGYMIGADGVAVMTSGFDQYVKKDV